MSNPRLHLARGLFALALLCAAAPGARAATAPATTSHAAAPTHPAALDTLLTQHLTYYEIYAPTEDELRGAAREVYFAFEQFRHSIGERTERIVFAVFASDAERARCDLTPIKRHLLPIVEYVGSVSGGAARSDGAAVAAARTHNARSLAHQAGHAFFYEFVKTQLRLRGVTTDSIPPTGDAVRGAEAHRLHGRIPDWFDEAVATSCESPSTRSLRLRAMGQSLDQRIPFADFFTMAMPANAQRAALFSNQASTLARFIGATEGDRFLGQMAIGLIEGKYTGQCLLDATKLYSKPEALEQQYVAWMRTQTSTTATTTTPAPATDGK